MKTAKQLTLGRALDLLTSLDSEQSAAEHEAVEAVRAKFTAKRAAIVERVPEEMRGRLAAMLEAASVDQERTASAALATFDKTFGSIPEMLDAPDETPSRPTLEEYDVPAGAREYVPGPAAQAARRGR